MFTLFLARQIFSSVPPSSLAQLRKANIVCKVAIDKERARERAALFADGEQALCRRKERQVPSPRIPPLPKAC